MIDENEIKRWIARLETEESSWSNYAKLATLYTVMNHQVMPEAQPVMQTAPAPQMYSRNYGESEFLQAVASVPAEKAWGIMDDLMDTLSVVNPRVYTSVLRKLRSA